MNRIENEQIRFYLEHESRIREWAGLEVQVSEFADRFYHSIRNDLDAAISHGELADDDVESFSDEPGKGWPGIGLRRKGWPSGTNDPDVRLEWNRKSARFSRDTSLVCGVRTDVESYKTPFAKEKRPGYRKAPLWAAYAYVDPPTGKFWEGDNLNLKEYRRYLVQTILDAWRDLAPLVDEGLRIPQPAADKQE